MAAKRKGHREAWPKGLREPRPGYYSYESPVSKRCATIGYVDLAQAIAYAKAANTQAAAISAQAKARRAASPHHDRDRLGLFELDHILSKAMTFDHVVGVYLLIDGDEVVYVGQSVTILRRLVAHKHEGTKEFSRVFVVECHETDLDRIERLYIQKFQPKYNAVAPRPAEGATAWRNPSIKELFGDALHPAHAV